MLTFSRICRHVQQYTRLVQSLEDSQDDCFGNGQTSYAWEILTSLVFYLSYRVLLPIPANRQLAHRVAIALPMLLSPALHGAITLLFMQF